MKKLVLIAIFIAVTFASAWWFFGQNPVSPQVTATPVHIEEKADAPNLPKPPSYVERVLKDNPHISRETAEQYEAERIQINVAHQEYRVRVLKEQDISDPQELIAVEQKLARELQVQFAALDEKYNIKIQQGASGFTGAPVTPSTQ